MGGRFATAVVSVLALAALWHLTLVTTMSSTLSSVLRVVFVTVPSREVALNISRSVVGTHLAACVNIVDGVTSVYEWEGKVHEDNEKLLIIKTQDARIEQLKEHIAKLHPYEVPEFVVLPVSHASETYGQWVTKQTGENDI